MNTRTFDVIIAGTGAAGLFAALSLPASLQILMITKDTLENSDSYLAQGGICMMKDEADYDSYFEDTMKAGRYQNNPESVSIMIRSSREIIGDLIDYGVEFERDHDGSLLFTREGAHSVCRILYHQDVTGREITGRLIRQAKNRPNIHIEEHTTMLDILETEGSCCGIITEKPGKTSERIGAKSVILATGGLGGLFLHSTNFRHITGDSFAIALRHGIALSDLHSIQIHPTTLYSRKKGRRFLISESVRGEGAILLNQNGERFVDELLPRDVVTEAIWQEMKRFGSPYVYLSFEESPMSEEEIRHRFPNIFSKCLEEGYNLAHDRIPVTPSQHYLMGGIKTDTYGRTSMNRLYATGETACNGVHGANRLASNSLLESLVFAKRTAHAIAGEIDHLSLLPVPEEKDLKSDKENRFTAYKAIIMKEIKRRDEAFYVKWCNTEN